MFRMKINPPKIGGAMKHLITISIIIILLASCAHNGQKWDAWDKALYGGLVAGSIADIATTNHNTDNGLREQNPICGDGQPETTIPINIAGLVAIYYIADYLPPKQRKWLLGVSNVLRWGAVGININAD